MSDPVVAVIDYLKADPTVLTLCAGRVFGVRMPHEEAADMPRAAVVVQPAGGNKPASYTQFYQQRLDIKCYGKTEQEIGALMIACIKALDGITPQNRRHTRIYAINLLTGRYTGVDPQTYWSFEFATFQVATHLSEV